MKKILTVLAIVMLIVVMGQVKAEEVMIPKDAIRLRVIPNSNEEQDQNIKEKVRNSIQQKLYTLLKNVKSIDEARSLIQENLDEFDLVVEEVMQENQIKETFKLNYGLNYFPQKIYKGVTYEEGYYESIVITLGKGEGDNWWCVLFPPLCLLEAEEQQEQSETEYKFFVKEIISKFFE